MAEWFHFTNMASGILYAALGVFALSVRPVRSTTSAFGIHGIAFGAAFIWYNAYELITGASPMVSQAILLAAAYASLFAVIMYSANPGSWFWGPAVAVLATGLASQLVYFILVTADVTVPDTILNVMYGLYNSTIFLGAWVLLSQPGRTSTQDVRMVLTAFLLYSAVADGMGLLWMFRSLSDPADAPPAEFWWNAGLWAAACLLFVVAAVRETSPATRRSAWRFAWLVMALLLSGAVLMLGYDRAPATHPLRGILRTVGFLVLTYAILRRSLLGIDVTVRWTISRTTLAGLFITVFFVVTETAQQLVGERFDSSYLGILAAGILVFAMTPLSRMADRLAEKAVPMASAHGGAARSSGLGPAASDSVYRAAVRAAMRDDVLTRREEVHLAEVAEGLGVGPRRALAIRTEVEEEGK